MSDFHGPALRVDAPAFQPRPYQDVAVRRAVQAHLSGRNPVLSLPTGSGKAFVAALIAIDLLARGATCLLLLVPSRELAEQNEAALLALLPRHDVGMVCAALERREIGRRVTVGTPQSVAGRFPHNPDCVIVDEAHQMPLHRGSWFARLFDSLPAQRRTPRIGLSGTTFRVADGAIYGSRDSWFDSEVFAISIARLVADDYLAPLRYVAPAIRMTTRGVARSAGDFNASQLVEANLDQVEPQVALILQEMRHRRRCMLFAINVEHARAYCDAFSARGEDPALIIGGLGRDERRDEVKAFKAGVKRIGVTVAAGLTGLDVPEIDLLASGRPTMSAIVHSQSLGRGTRPAEGKVDCLNLDFAGNVPRFGPIASPHFDRSGQPITGVAPWRPCRRCGVYAHFEAITCDECSAILPPGKLATPRDLEFGTIDWRSENRALHELVARQGAVNLPVEALAVHAYRRPADRESVSLMISYALGGSAILRTWTKKLGTRHWAAIWRDLMGPDPAPRDYAEALNRRHELTRPLAIDIRFEEPFWRVERVHHDEDASEGWPSARMALAHG